MWNQVAFEKAKNVALQSKLDRAVLVGMTLPSTSSVSALNATL